MSPNLRKKILLGQKYTDTLKTCHPARTKLWYTCYEGEAKYHQNFGKWTESNGVTIHKKAASWVDMYNDTYVVVRSLCYSKESFDIKSTPLT